MCQQPPKISEYKTTWNDWSVSRSGNEHLLAQCAAGAHTWSKILSSHYKYRIVLNTWQPVKVTVDKTMTENWQKLAVLLGGGPSLDTWYFSEVNYSPADTLNHLHCRLDYNSYTSAIAGDAIAYLAYFSLGVASDLSSDNFLPVSVSAAKYLNSLQCSNLQGYIAPYEMRNQPYSNISSLSL